MEIKDLAGISEPLKRLIEVISEGAGAISHPYLIRKNADAKAYEIRVISQAMAESHALLGGMEYEDGKIKILPESQESSEQLSLPNRTENRRKYQELRKQQNIESICANSAELLIGESQVAEDKPESDWINRFFEIAENISAEELQYIWGKILAGEIQKPGSFSFRTLETLKNMSRQEAENFCKLGQYVFQTSNMAFYVNPEEYLFKQENTLGFAEIFALKDAGVVADSDLLQFSFNPSSAGTTSQIFYGSLILFFEREKDTPKITSRVGALTKAGVELLKLVPIQPDIEYVKFIAQHLHADGMKVAWAPVVKTEGDLIYTGDKTYLESM
ncbi:DUF2806 domain-containing protein [Egbenema bharatensis]|uniref:DUF2806 domain-containing protein n=1 Tax=Egbenema bharatensis TaxID=3463334 RepID=UPI003A845C6A